MLTSGQIAQIMAAQQAQFMQAQAASQQISAQMPMPYMGGTIGAYQNSFLGSTAPPVPGYRNLPYAPGGHHSRGFSYGGSEVGYGMGSRAGAFGVTALGGAATAALGIGGMFSNYLDPFGGAIAGMGRAFSAGRGVMGIAGAGVMGAIPGMAIAALAAHGIGNTITGAQEQSAVQNMLGQFNFINAGSRTGRGFSRQDSMAIGNMIREMQAIPEMMTSMGELTRVANRLGQMGMMQGVRDAQEFQKRFREQISTLKDLSRVMGTTMEEATAFMGQSRSMGFYSKGAIMQNAARQQLIGGVTGMSQQQVMALQAQGAMTSFAWGGSRAGGARGIGRVAGELGMAQQMGILSDERIMEMTGMEGPEGLGALAGAVNEAGYRMAQSSLGNAMTLALGKVEGGRYTGEMDADLVARVRRGEIGKSELIKLARSKSRGRGAKLSYKAHQGRLRSEMVNSVGLQGITMELSGILGERGWTNPDAQNLVMERYGLDERMAGLMVEMGKQMPAIEAEMGMAGGTEMRRIAEQTYLRENASWEGIRRKIGKRFENVFEEPFRKIGASISHRISTAWDNFTDDLFGRYRLQLTQEASAIMSAAGRGDARAKAALAGSSKKLSAVGGMGENFVPTSFSGRYLTNAMSRYGGQSSYGEQGASLLGAMGEGTLRYSDAKKLASQGLIVWDEAGVLGMGDEMSAGRGGYEQVVTSRRDIEVMQRRLAQGKLRASVETDRDVLRKSGFFGKGTDWGETMGNFGSRDLANYLRSQNWEGVGVSDRLNKILEHLDKRGVLKEARRAAGLQEHDTSADMMIVQELQQHAVSKGHLIEGEQGTIGLDEVRQFFDPLGKYRGMGEEALADQRTAVIDKISEQFGGEGQQAARSIFEKGGAGAMLLSQALGGGIADVSAKEVETLLLSPKPDEALKTKVLSALELSEKEFESNKEAVVQAFRSSGGHVDKKLLRERLEIDLAQGQKVTRESRLSHGQRLSGALSAYESEVSEKLGKGGLGALSSIKKFAALAGDTGDISEQAYSGGYSEAILALSETGETDYGRLQKLLSPELARGSGMLRRVRKNKLSTSDLENLGFDRASASELSKSFEKYKEGGISKDEFAEIKKTLAERAAGTLYRPSDKGGTVADAKSAAGSLAEFVKLVGQLGDNVQKTTDAVAKLQGL